MATIKTINKRRKKKLQEIFKLKREKWMEKQKSQDEKYKYNPPPTREIKSIAEQDAKRALLNSEKKRNKPSGTQFSSWEYKDRFSYKKQI